MNDMMCPGSSRNAGSKSARLFTLIYRWCSISTMVKWANDGLLQANNGKMLVNDGEKLVNDGEMNVWYTHFTIFDEHFNFISLM